MQVAAAMFTPASLIAAATSARAPGVFSMSMTRSTAMQGRGLPPSCGRSQGNSPAVIDDATEMDTSQQSIAARLRQSAASLGPFEYAVTLVLLAIYAIGTSMNEGPDTSMDFYRAAATVIPTLLITVAIQGRVFELSRKVTFRHQCQSISPKKIVTPPVAKLGMSLTAAWPSSEPRPACSESMSSNVSSAMR